MRAVVTGGAGFLGSHLCTRLVSDGHEVVCVDNMLTGAARNVEHLIGEPGFVLIKHDVTNFVHIGGPVDYVFHFASPASPTDFERLPIQILKVGALGTHKALGLAREKGAKFFLASTSEVYGDPEVSPQPEDYWGHVNPVGIRGVYDEAKRFGEAMSMAYHRVHDIDVKIVRFFNSILADEHVVVFHDGQLHHEPVGRYGDRLELASGAGSSEVLVPAFDPQSLRMELRPAKALIKHGARDDAFELLLRYGRSVRVTGDHSVFVRGEAGLPEAKPVRDIRPGEYVAVPARMPMVERDRPEIDLAHETIEVAQDPDELWSWAIRSPEVTEIVRAHREKIHIILEESGRYQTTKNFRNTLTCATNKWMKTGVLPLYVLQRLGLESPTDARFGPYGSSNRWVPNRVGIDGDLLWLLGFFIAEGNELARRGVYFISFCSDVEYLSRAKSTLEQIFGVHVGFVPPSKRAPVVYAHSKALQHLFVRLLCLRDGRIPRWIMQLPLDRLKHVLEGFRCGDGTHSGVKLGSQLSFNSSKEQIALDLNLILLRFGVVASLGHYETTNRKRSGDRRFPFWRLTVSALSNFDILTWDEGLTQALNARRSGDLVWSKVREVRPCRSTGYVYDFSVPQAENFVAGNGVCCHNTHGPRMRADDGRAVPEFITAALRGRPLVVHGDGSQTRSIAYVDDTIEGVIRLAMSSHVGPMNIGTPDEVSMLELAKLIIEITNSASPVEFGPLPPDDPKVRRPDISLAKKVIGWEPAIPLEEGLRRTAEWFAKELAT